MIPVAWTLVGLAGQALFTARTGLQWLVSERAGEVRIPRGYWELSLGGCLLVLGYAVHTGDPVFSSGALVSAWIFSRNLILERRATEAGEARRAWLPLAIGLGLLVPTLLHLLQTPPVPEPLGWRVAGGLGQTLWLLRYPYQWYWSERAGRSQLPAGFWALGLVGSVLLLTYALRRGDPVFVLAYLLNPLPYARNLRLSLKESARRGVPQC